MPGEAGFLEPFTGGSHGSNLGVARRIIFFAHSIEPTQDQAAGFSFDHRRPEGRLGLRAETGAGELDQRLHLLQILIAGDSVVWGHRAFFKHTVFHSPWTAAIERKQPDRKNVSAIWTPSGTAFPSCLCPRWIN
jgi:hypothetical protein